ncbi:MAG: RlmE family RNA methyltransferase [Spirochaetota bacterium]
MAKRGRRRQDHYSRRAHAEGYRARSVYKLDELQKKFGLIPSGARVLDLGAAPGSWSQRLLEIAGAAGVVVACDIKPLEISGPGNLISIQGDFTDRQTRSEIDAHGPFDAVVSDAAPATTGNRTVDTARSEVLVESALAIAEGVLKHGGSVVVKLFQGGAEQRLRGDMQRLFEKVAQAKPGASRKESFEVYLVGLGYRGGNGHGDDSSTR